MRDMAFCGPSLTTTRSENHLFAALVSVRLASLLRSTARASLASIVWDWRVCARPRRSSASTRYASGLSTVGCVGLSRWGMGRKLGARNHPLFRSFLLSVSQCQKAAVGIQVEPRCHPRTEDGGGYRSRAEQSPSR